jgi:hypothetical protein
MRTTIKFATRDANAPKATGREAAAAVSQFVDNTFKPEYKDLVLKFEQPATWLRILPSIEGSLFPWLAPFSLHTAPNGKEFPKFVSPGQISLWNEANRWLNKNRKQALKNKDTNPSGINLYPSDRGLAWVLVQGAEEGHTLRLLNVSTYSGERGGTMGLGHNILEQALLEDSEPGSETQGQPVFGDITDPKTGRMICITKKAAASKAEFASYSVQIGKKATPFTELFDKLTDAELKLIVPLENTLQIPTREDEERYLRQYLGNELVNEILGKK